MISPSLSEFKALASLGNLIPIYAELPADLETPVSAYLKTESTYSFLLESVEGGENMARFSFIGTDPLILFNAKANTITLTQNGQTETLTGNPIDQLQQVLSQFSPVTNIALPRFHGGAVGYFSYDAIRYIENIPDQNPDELNIPDVSFMIATNILAFDHVKHKIMVISNAHVNGTTDSELETVYQIAVNDINKLIHQLKQPLSPEKYPLTSPSNDTTFQSNMTRDEYASMVEKAKKYIYAGDIFQVVLSQRFTKSTNDDPFMIYRRLRMVNPSPYMFYLKFNDLQLIGSSPEILVRLENDKATLRPIAGTRPRGTTPEEDLSLEKELLADEKEKAEHIMLVDLGRNDLGRVCEFQTVKTTSLMHIERYSHVMHIVSNIEGKIKSGYTGFDLIKACFPAGTVSGAPKVRAMEIIDELETVKRGAYAGAIGYFDFAGNMDTGIIIRTIVVKDQKVYMQSGGGIVFDSDPDMEFNESMNKAKPLLLVS